MRDWELKNLVENKLELTFDLQDLAQLLPGQPQGQSLKKWEKQNIWNKYLGQTQVFRVIDQGHLLLKGQGQIQDLRGQGLAVQGHGLVLVSRLVVGL